jgi:threonine/homoserine/homoserine lactone efflux protein
MSGRAGERTMRGMPPLSTLLVFVAATAALVAIPGPSVLFIVARSLEHGRVAGLISMAGIEVGALLHVALATAGVSALVAGSPVVLDAVKFAGAAYLLAMGVRALRRRGEPLPAASVPRRALFRQGLVVDALNPKTALFFLAFLPQFVDPARGSAALQTAVLGMCFVVLATLSDGLYALAAGTLSERLRRSRRARRRLDGVSGAAYLGLGLVAGAAPA